MRSLWPARDACRYLLNGEVDKSGHALLEQWGFKGEKPDLLVHGPGHMADNHAVIEVKPSTVDHRGIVKDLTKLALFRSRARYQRGIYLIYGEAADARVVRLIRLAEAEVEQCDGIEIWPASGSSRGSHAVLRPVSCAPGFLSLRRTRYQSVMGGLGAFP